MEPGSKEVEQEPVVLTPEYAGKLFFLTYKFSQGEPLLQNNINQYIHDKKPAWRIESAQEVLNHAYNKISHVISASTNSDGSPKRHTIVHKEGVNTKAAIDEARTMQRIINGIPVKRAGEIVPGDLATLTKGIISRDYKFLNQRGGRHRKGEGTGHMLDPYLSHFIYFGLEGHGTGAPIFDQMFREIAQYAQKNYEILHPLTKTHLETITYRYQHHHPDYVIPDFLK